MEQDLQTLLEKAKGVTLTPEQIEEQRLQMVAATGHLADSRITVDTVRATRTIMKTAEEIKAPQRV